MILVWSPKIKKEKEKGEIGQEKKNCNYHQQQHERNLNNLKPCSALA
jgi:hypothetical protein